jgi:hypothetical protein
MCIYCSLDEYELDYLELDYELEELRNISWEPILQHIKQSIETDKGLITLRLRLALQREASLDQEERKTL